VDDFQKLERKAYGYLLLMHLALIIFALAVFFVGVELDIPIIYVALVDGGLTFLLAYFAARAGARFLMQPLQMLWQAILHVAPDTTSVAAPDIEHLRLGRQLVIGLANRVYQFASQQDSGELASHRQAVLQAVNIVSHFPLPVLVFNKQQVITNASDSTLKYLGVESPQLFGQQLADCMKLEFAGTHTLEQWVADCQASKATDQAYWQRVKVRLRDGLTIKQCDIAAYYNRDNASGTEFIVTLFDHTDLYQHDEDDLSFIALAVHELRTPLTALRGYIEALEEDLEGKLSPEQAGYMRRLSLSGDQLTKFVTNILNVVKLEGGQLNLELTQANWEPTLRAASADVLTRAEIMGKTISFQIQPNLPPVAVDPVTIGEVVNNLLDNALKYSGQSKEILVSASLNRDSQVETTVTDQGVGIPESVLPNLFEKFYRNHRTKASIGGTGLGLYLSKAIITAHGGQIWVKSKVDQGSTFGFTLQPYASLSQEQKNAKRTDITRHGHGWIKNHSLYRK
jgi:signal transduction histidine kinase